MGWQTGDGSHEGWAAPLFADGALGSGWDSGGVMVTDLADRRLSWEERQIRPDADVIGWVAVCGCGWRGIPYTRARTPEDENRSERRWYSPDSFAPGSLEESVHEEWKAHTAPGEAVSEVAELAGELSVATIRLNDAVVRARAAGASWASIGRAAGMTRQSAHERWARLTSLAGSPDD